MKNIFRVKINAIICMFGLIAAVFLPVAYVNAANKTVTITEASAESSGVEVSGTTDAEAVIVQLRDATGDEIIAMKSFPVVDGAFTGSITDVTIEEGTDYMIFVADYEGGDFATETVAIEVTTEDDETSDTSSQSAPAVTTETTSEVKEADIETTEATTAAPENDSTAQTGDTTNVALLTIVMFLSGAGIFVTKKLSADKR
ncbi:MAG: hypothetical protein IJ703_11155 [Eubacterium sp.]|nr:hypothetical protein [Eubacterium sp.]